MKEEMLKEIFNKGFINHNHYQVKDIEKEKKAILKVELTDKALNPYGYAHGGLIFGLGDTAMGIVAKSNSRKAVTENCSITYLKPTTGKELTAIAEAIKIGKRVCYLKCDFYNDNKELTATMNGTYFYID